MSRELPASPAPVAVVATHFSTKRPGWGMRVAVLASGEFGVYSVSPIDGRPTARLFDRVSTEEQARGIANREWVGMGL